MAKVIKRFKDKYTKKVFKEGDSYSHKDDERIAFLIDKGYIKEEKKKESPKKKKEEK